MVVAWYSIELCGFVLSKTANATSKTSKQYPDFIAA